MYCSLVRFISLQVGDRHQDIDREGSEEEGHAPPSGASGLRSPAQRDRSIKGRSRLAEAPEMARPRGTPVDFLTPAASLSAISLFVMLLLFFSYFQKIWVNVVAVLLLFPVSPPRSGPPTPPSAERLGH